MLSQRSFQRHDNRYTRGRRAIIRDGSTRLATHMDIPPSSSTRPSAVLTALPEAPGARGPTLQSPPAALDPTMIARVLTARPATGGGWILELDIGGETVDARSRVALPSGARLVLQTLSTDRARVTQLLPTRDTTQMLVSTLRAMLPLQIPLHEALAKLNNAVRNPHLPVAVAERLHELLARTPSPAQLRSAAGLRKAVLDSGSFLEARLQRLPSSTTPPPRNTPRMSSTDTGPSADPVHDKGGDGLRKPFATLRRLLVTLEQPRTQAPQAEAPPPGAGTGRTPPPGSLMLANDLKARLFAVLGELDTAMEQLPAKPVATGTARPAGAHSLPLYGQGGRLLDPFAPATLPQDADSAARHAPASPRGSPSPGREPAQTAELITQVLRTVEAALARTRIHQISSHTDNPQRAEIAPQQAWNVELPIMRDNGFDALELQIEEHGEPGNASTAGEREWLVRLKFDLEAMGVLHAQLRLKGRRLATTLWLANPRAFAFAQEDLSTLSEALRTEGVEISQLDCLAGEPPRTQVKTSLLEIST